MIDEPQDLPEEETPEIEAEAPELSAIEEEAKKYGWRPKEEFDLAPEGWVDAKRFMEFPTTQNKVLRDEIANVRASVESEFGERFKKLEGTTKAAMDAALQQQKEAYEAKMAEISRGQLKAVEEADTEAYQALEKQKGELTPPKVQGPQPIDIVAEYGDKHSWVKEPAMFAQAQQIVGLGLQQGTLRTSDAGEQLAFAEAQLKGLFPHKFQAPEAPKPKVTRVDGGGLATGGGKGVNSLPPEALAAGREFVESGVFKSMEDYAKTYFAQGA